MRRTVTEGQGSRRLLSRLALLSLVLVGAVQAVSAAWIPAKAVVAQVLLDRAFVQSQQLGEPVRPWSWADTAPLARISIPRLHEQAIVLSGASGQALAFGPSEVPTPRSSNVTIYAAHRDTHFDFFQEMREGEEIVVERLEGEAENYEITQFQTVRWDEFAISRRLSGEWLALVTCFPFDANEQGPLRRVAWARRSE